MSEIFVLGFCFCFYVSVNTWHAYRIIQINERLQKPMTFKITWKDGLVITPWERPIGPTHGPSDPSSSSGSPVKDAMDLAQDVSHSPLDQFAIKYLYISFTNPAFFMLLTLGLVFLLFHLVTKKGGGKSVPNAWQSLVELIYDFVPNLANEQIGGLSGNVKQKFFPCISGMIPYSFTVTSHFLITLGLSFSIFIGITLVGFQRNGLHFLSFSLPIGVPLPLAPLLVLLELIPHSFHALSSGIRLFPNMMAGYSSVKILSGSAWTMLCMNDLFYFIGDLGPLRLIK
ncbi:hypothetical protein Ahy_A02g007125 [Arachis hypogaea]|uniref:F-ATPase protein 6 n=1 Tax=Arachis hypogaea TaxID=3818 RepID=A0A445EC59_ARAHY|nr:hypothetical protein Ahy_A02g007125 [Arachis hypogaea]